jgi:hypothetical protein
MVDDAIPRCLAPAGFTMMVLLTLTGCARNSLYPVNGKLVWEDGKPVTELASGMVVLETPEGAPVARAGINPDGTFRLGSTAPGDGAVPGRYRVAVIESRQGEPPPPPKLELAHAKFETSGLEINVEPKTNEVTLQVRRAKPSKGQAERRPVRDDVPPHLR